MDDSKKYDYFVEKELFSEIKGWVDPGVFFAIKLLDVFQKQNMIHGSICEIGVHHGRFFIPLCLLRNPGETAIAVDVFDNQKQNVDQSGFGDINTFTKNLALYTNNELIKIVKADSMILKFGDILKHTDGEMIRLFSVDGSHTAEHTVNDLLLAQETITSGGVIFIDDFFNKNWPGVMEGINKFFVLNANRKVAPVAYGNNKLYLTTLSHLEDYYTMFNQATTYKKKKEVSMWGYKVLFINF